MRRAAVVSRKAKLEAAPVLVADGPSVPTKRPRRKQLLQFSENERPPFWGVWSSQDVSADSNSSSSDVVPAVRPLGSAFGYGSCVVSGRRPFAQDTTKMAHGVVQYDYDSDEEWEGGEPSETLNSDVEHSDDDDDEELAALTAEERNAKEFDMNDGWMCADDVVVYSDDEEYSDAEELEDQDGTGPLDIDRVVAKDNHKRKNCSGGPDGNASAGYNDSDSDDDNDGDAPKHRRKIRRIKAMQEEPDGINNGRVEMFSPMFFSELAPNGDARQAKLSSTATLSASGTVLQSFRAVSLVSCPIDPNLFLKVSNKRTSTEVDDATHLPDLCSMVHMAKSLKQVVTEFQAVYTSVSTTNVREKVRAIATRNTKMAGVSGSCWCVNDDVLKMCGLDDESLQDPKTLAKAQAASGTEAPEGFVLPTASAVQRMQARLQAARKNADQEKADAAAAAAEASARQFRDNLHLPALLSLLHFTSDSKDTIVTLFLQFFPLVTKIQILRKIGECTSRMAFHGGQRWVVAEDVLVQTKLDRTTITAAATSPVPVPPAVLDDGTTALVSGSPEGNACLQKWFSGLSAEARMRFRFSEMDACAAAAAEEVQRTEAAKLAKEQAKLARKEAKEKRLAEAERKRKDAEAKRFRDDLHLSTFVSLVHFSSNSIDSVVTQFHQFFPEIAQLQITRKLSASANKKSFHVGRRWVVNDELLMQTKLDRGTVMAPLDSAAAAAAATVPAVPVPPTVLEDGTTALVAGSPEGDSCLWKWFCALSVEARMRFRFSEMDACAAAVAAGVEIKKKKRAKLTMPVGWTAVQKVRASGASAGTLDTIFHSPDGLTKCRSLVEIYRHLESQKNQGTLSLATLGSAKKRKRPASSEAAAVERGGDASQGAAGAS